MIVSKILFHSMQRAWTVCGGSVGA